MPYATTKDNVKLYYEEAGSGTPILFCHEFAGDYRNWEQQMRYFSRRHRCITYSARGYLPSDVPKDWKFSSANDTVMMFPHANAVFNVASTASNTSITFGGAMR